ncbi:hypothetical protein PISL3812_03145 [Talaromyces islandicus]|uniref:Uncharacterized protein n=1 Tax=Talaromyces islandicus TaxID=28573 RepID=A0A0U1LSM8_TALIS|nr:hypothetical protein PISL3812_03145 [Talaromyces islandicus]
MATDVFGESLEALSNEENNAARSELVNLVGDASLALVEVINRLPSPAEPRLCRDLKIALAHLVAEIKSNEILQALGQRQSFRNLLKRLAQSLSGVLNGDFIRERWQFLAKEEAKIRTRRLNFLYWTTKSEEQEEYLEALKRWSESPFPVLGMFYELKQRHHNVRDEVDLAGLVNENQQLLRELVGLVNRWNDLVDGIYANVNDALDGDLDSAEKHYPSIPIHETAFHGETSVRSLSRALYDVLHSNWPCHSEGHDHDGKLGGCFEAKFFLDPQWSSKNPASDGFFVVLTGPDLFQECRIYLVHDGKVCHDSIHRGDCFGPISTNIESHSIVCLIAYEDSRSVCLHLAVDDQNLLLDQQKLAQPLEVFMPEDDYVEHDLGQLLEHIRPTYAAKRVMGVILARAILHLFEGPWVSRSMSIGDIFVYCKMQNDQPYPLFDKVFVSTKFGGENLPKDSAYNVHPFPTILALGIVLTEIELGEDLADLYKNPAFDSLRRRPFDLAKRLLKECELRLHLESGLIRAVKSCTDRTSLASFANSNSSVLFSNPDFVAAYYTKIIRPLEEDLVQGANWTWDEVNWLKRRDLDSEGILKMKTERSGPAERGQSFLHNRYVRSSVRSLRPVVEKISEHTNSAQGRHFTASSIPECLSMKFEKRKSQPIHHQSFTQDGSSMEDLPPRPYNRDEFDIAIICALPKEASAVLSVFDKIWDESEYKYGRASNDPNSYTAGVISGHNVVLAHPPRMGKANAAVVASTCAMSFRNVKLALVVGICGGVPRHPDTGEDILLGDVVISKGVIQYDFGRQYPDQFKRKISVDDMLGRPSVEVSSLLAKLETKYHRTSLQGNISKSLVGLRKQHTPFYPGRQEDRLFYPTYRHKHQTSSECQVCCKSQDGSIEFVCETAIDSTCRELQCDKNDHHLVTRTRHNQKNKPFVHIGLIASGDTVMKSGVYRDTIARETKVIAFEMEGAGVWDIFPGVIIIKGLCDYADSHKSKLWQSYAAATSAACMKAFLRHWDVGPE